MVSIRAPASLDFGQGLADIFQGNASIHFSDGLLASQQQHPVSIDPSSGRVAKIPANNPGFTLGLSARSGVFSGRFLHTDGTRPVYRGILLNKGTNTGGFGFFVGNGINAESGGVSVDPAGP